MVAYQKSKGGLLIRHPSRSFEEACLQLHEETPRGSEPPGEAPLIPRVPPTDIGWQYLSNATRLMRPRLFHARFVMSRITISCHMIRHS